MFRRSILSLSKSQLLSKSHALTFSSHSKLTSNISTKISTGITGLQADPSARSNLLEIYEKLGVKLGELPETYAYRTGLQALIDNRLKLLKDEGMSDLDLELAIGEGQLEELREQAEEELKLLEKVANEWKPWTEN